MCDSLLTAEQAIEVDKETGDGSLQRMQVAELKKRNRALEAKNSELTEQLSVRDKQRERDLEIIAEEQRLVLEAHLQQRRESDTCQKALIDAMIEQQLQHEREGLQTVELLKSEIAHLSMEVSTHERDKVGDIATISKLTDDASELRARVELLDSGIVSSSGSSHADAVVTGSASSSSAHGSESESETGTCTGESEYFFEDEEDGHDGEDEGDYGQSGFEDDVGGAKEEGEEGGVGSRESAEMQQQYLLAKALGIKAIKSPSTHFPSGRPRTLTMAMKERRAFRGGEAVRTPWTPYSISSTPFNSQVLQSEDTTPTSTISSVAKTGAGECGTARANRSVSPLSGPASMKRPVASVRSAKGYNPAASPDTHHSVVISTLEDAIDSSSNSSNRSSTGNLRDVYEDENVAVASRSSTYIHTSESLNPERSPVSVYSSSGNMSHQEELECAFSPFGVSTCYDDCDVIVGVPKKNVPQEYFALGRDFEEVMDTTLAANAAAPSECIEAESFSVDVPPLESHAAQSLQSTRSVISTPPSPLPPHLPSPLTVRHVAPESPVMEEKGQRNALARHMSSSVTKSMSISSSSYSRVSSTVKTASTVTDSEVDTKINTAVDTEADLQPSPPSAGVVSTSQDYGASVGRIAAAGAQLEMTEKQTDTETETLIAIGKTSKTKTLEVGVMPVDQVQEIKSMLSQHLERFEAISLDFRQAALKSLERNRSRNPDPFRVESDQAHSLGPHLAAETVATARLPLPSHAPAISHMSQGQGQESEEEEGEEGGEEDCVSKRILHLESVSASERVSASGSVANSPPLQRPVKHHTQSVPDRAPPYHSAGATFEEIKKQLAQQLDSIAWTDTTSSTTPLPVHVPVPDRTASIAAVSQQRHRNRSGEAVHSRAHRYSYSNGDRDGDGDGDRERERPHAPPPRSATKAQTQSHTQSQNRGQEAFTTHATSQSRGETVNKEWARRSLQMDLRSSKDELASGFSFTPTSQYQRNIIPDGHKAKGHSIAAGARIYPPPQPLPLPQPLNHLLSLRSADRERDRERRSFGASIGQSQGPSAFTNAGAESGDRELSREYSDYCMEMEYEKYLAHFRRERERVAQELSTQRKIMSAVKAVPISSPPSHSSSSYTSPFASAPSSSSHYSDRERDRDKSDEQLVNVLRVAKVALDVSQSDMRDTQRKMQQLSAKVDLLQHENRSLRGREDYIDVPPSYSKWR